MRVGSLFAGIGGFDLAARWMGWETRWYSEIDPYASKVMRKNFPDAPNLGDITKITNPPPVDVLVGGFPCQDISLAGKGAGIEGTRSGLWSHYARIIEEIRPSWVVAENVAALRSRGLDRVLRDLDALGYDAEWHCIPASYVGATHQRDRIWIVAYPHGRLGWGPGGSSSLLEGWVAREAERAHVRCEGEPCADHAGSRSALVGDTNNAGCCEQRGSVAVSAQLTSPERAGWWGAEPDVGRVAHGVPSRVDRLRCLGNAVVPQVPCLIFRAIEACHAAGLRQF